MITKTRKKLSYKIITTYFYNNEQICTVMKMRCNNANYFYTTWNKNNLVKFINEKYLKNFVDYFPNPVDNGIAIGEKTINDKIYRYKK